MTLWTKRLYRLESLVVKPLTGARNSSVYWMYFTELALTLNFSSYQMVFDSPCLIKYFDFYKNLSDNWRYILPTTIKLHCFPTVSFLRKIFSPVGMSHQCGCAVKSFSCQSGTEWVLLPVALPLLPAILLGDRSSPLILLILLNLYLFWGTSDEVLWSRQTSGPCDFLTCRKRHSEVFSLRLGYVPK